MAIHARNLAGATLVAAAVALSSLTAGAGLALADPGHGGPGQCPPQGCEQNGPGGHDQRQNGPGNQGGPGNQNGWGNQNGPGNQNGWNQGPPQGYRGIDEGRRDHQPFDWQGQQVAPIFAPQFNQWGFWFLGLWIPL